MCKLQYLISVCILIMIWLIILQYQSQYGSSLAEQSRQPLSLKEQDRSFFREHKIYLQIIH